MKVPVLPPPDDDDDIAIEFVNTDGAEKGDGASGNEESPAGTTARSPAVAGQSSENLLSEQERIRELEDMLLRRAADYENLQRRVDREKLNYRRQAKEEILREILPVVDNMDRALESTGEDASGEWQKGLELMRQQLLDILEKFGVERIESVGYPFDPTIHEAVALSEASDYPPNTVTMEYEKGYLLDGRTLKPAKVVVSPPAEANGQGRENFNG